MKIIGIITEYNPFHLGHEYHLNASLRKSKGDALVCIMSGNYVQRGIPAMVDKWTRTEMALAAGVDLVIELPTIFSISSAEFFSFGAISTLNAMNVVEEVCFGSEHGDCELLYKVAEIIEKEPPYYKSLLKEYLEKGLPFTTARSNSIIKYLTTNMTVEKVDVLENLLNSSNNILGIEYCKSLIKCKSNIKPSTIKREGSDYNSLDFNYEFASASAIRKSLLEMGNLEAVKRYLPAYSYNILEKYIADGFYFTNDDRLFSYVKYKLINNPEILEHIPEAKEGLSNKILKELPKVNTLNELILSVKSKRYTYTRISRILCSVFLNVDENIIKLRNKTPQYIRILGFNEKGKKILKKVKDRSSVNIITKLPKKIEDKMLKFDVNSTNLYSLLNNKIKINHDYLQSPIIIK